MTAHSLLRLTVFLTAISAVVPLILTLVSINQVGQIESQEAGPREYTWLDASAYCDQLNGGWRLPTLIEATGLLYAGRLKQQHTDYWSSNHLFGYAWGINTHRYIWSYDRFADIDHVICVRP